MTNTDCDDSYHDHDHGLLLSLILEQKTCRCCWWWFSWTSRVATFGLLYLKWIPNQTWIQKLFLRTCWEAMADNPYFFTSSKTPPGLGTVPPPNGWPVHRHYALEIHRVQTFGTWTFHEILVRFIGILIHHPIEAIPSAQTSFHYTSLFLQRLHSIWGSCLPPV